MRHPCSEPTSVVLRRQNDRHTIMHIGDQLVRRRRRDHARFDSLPLGISPPIPNPGERENSPTLNFEAEGLLLSSSSFPLVKAIGRYEAPLTPKRLPKRWLGGRRLRSSIKQSSDPRILRPRRD